MKIHLIVQYDSAFDAVANITVPAMRAYASRHGYEFTALKDHPVRRTVIWDRYRNLHEAANPDADWVVHMDADVLITNHHIRIEGLVDEHVNPIITRTLCEDGQRRFNDGVVLIPQDYLSTLAETSDYPQSPDEGIYCSQDVFERHSDYRTLFDVIPHKCMNSFLYTEYGMPPTTIGHWTPGDFVLHLPGRTNERRVGIFNKTEVIQ